MSYTPDQVVAAFTTQYERRNLTFTIRFRDLAAVPPWLPTKEHPPLSPRKAIVLATAYLPSLVAEAPR